MTCFTHKKPHLLLSDPLCFEASTEARRIQNTNGPLNWPSNWGLWKSNGCHYTDGTTACFPPVRNMKNIHHMLIFMILLFEVATTLTARVNKSVKASIIEHKKEGLYGWKQQTIPCRFALLACWCDCCFSVIAAVHYCSNLSSDPWLSHTHKHTQCCFTRGIYEDKTTPGFPKKGRGSCL